MPQPETPTARSLRSELVETYIETGCTDRTSQEGADEFLARHRAVVLAEAADLLEAQSCACGCRRAVEFLRYLVTEPPTA